MMITKQIKITKRRHEAFSLLLANQSYTETAKSMGLSKPRVAQLCECVARTLKYDPYMRIVFSHTCMSGIKNNHAAVKEAFFRIVNQTEFSQ
jgi:hypothetical protein